MLDAPGESSNLHKSSTGGLSSTWPTRWAYDAVEEMEVAEDHVFWQASQTKDPVLDKLLSDAHGPQKRPLPAYRPDLSKPWSPSPGSVTSDTTSSTSSSKAVTRRQRPTKRRLQGATTATQVAVPPAESSSIAKQLLEWAKKLPDISKKVDEDALRKVKELKETQKNKRRKAARTSGNGVSKKYGTSTIGQLERRVPDPNHKEEEMSGVEGAVHEHRKNNENAQRGEVVPPTGSMHLMPPPPSFQPRKHFTNGGKSLLTARNVRDMLDLVNPLSHNPDASIDGLSFSSSAIVTSTPKHLPGPDAYTDSRHLNTLLVAGHGKGDTTDDIRSAVLPTAPDPGPVETERTTHAPWFAKTNSTGVSSNQNAHPTPSIPLPTPVECVPIFDPTQPLAMPAPKSTGPRPLGMRRTMNGQAPSLSQGLSRARSSETNLPVKQSGFKVPFAKQKPVIMPAPAEARSHREPLLASDSNTAIGARERPSSRIHPSHVDCGQKVGFASVEKPSQACLSLPRSKPERRDTRTVGSVNDRSSSPPADADSSFDFDMNFDPDELEKVCKAYD